MLYLYLYLGLVAFALVFTYLWLANHAMTKEYDEVYKYAQKPWGKDEMKRVYDEAKRGPIDVRAYLPPNQNRRYIVLGGSGVFPFSCCLQVSGCLMPSIAQTSTNAVQMT